MGKSSQLPIAACLAVAIHVAAAAQTDPSEAIGGPLTADPVVGAPFSADATTTAHLVFSDGTRLDRSTTAHYYRDGSGRARVELLMDGLEAPKTVRERAVRTIVAPGPARGAVFTLDSATRTTRSIPRSAAAYAAGGDIRFAVPFSGVAFMTFARARDELARDPQAINRYGVQDEPLGSRRIEGVETVGRRVTMIVPSGERYGPLSSDHPFELVDERWESPELRLLVAGHFSDTRTGVVDYQLTNIKRSEPSPELFGVPPDYAADHTSVTCDPLIGMGPVTAYPVIKAALARCAGAR